MTPRKERALQALLTARTREEAAKEAGIGVSTLRMYLHDPEFRDRYKSAMDDQLREASRRAQSGALKALEVLEDVVSKAEGTGHRLQAARTLLEYSVKLAEVSDFMERIEALERKCDSESEF